jgi:hypothetical protein
MNSWVLVSTVVGSTVLGDLLQSFEMKRHGEIRFSKGGLGRIAATLAMKKYLILAIFCMAISFFAFMTLVSEADLSFAVPATAASFVFDTVLARFAQGIANDFLSTLYLATTAPVVVAPAMNVNMWNHVATQGNLEILRKRPL